MKYLIILISIVTMACSKDGGGGSPAPASKNLFSLWTGDTSTSDFTGMGFGANDFDIAIDATSGCLCTLDIQGDQLDGSMTLHSCVAYGSATCTSGTIIYGYAIDNSILAICSASTCTEYR